LISHRPGADVASPASATAMNSDIWRSCSVRERFLFPSIREKHGGHNSVSDRLIGRDDVSSGKHESGLRASAGEAILHPKANLKTAKPSGWPPIPIGRRRSFQWRNIRPARKPGRAGRPTGTIACSTAARLLQSETSLAEPDRPTDLCNGWTTTARVGIHQLVEGRMPLTEGSRHRSQDLMINLGQTATWSAAKVLRNNHDEKQDGNSKHHYARLHRVHAAIK
jgi:hypothetical protein